MIIRRDAVERGPPYIRLLARSPIITNTREEVVRCSMPAQQQAMSALQTLDKGIEQDRQRIRALQAELADERAVISARARARAAREELAAAETAVRDGEAALERLDRTITMLAKRLYDGSIHNAKEATSVEEELRHRRDERGATEDRVLAAMERVEQEQAASDAATTALSAAEQARAARVPAIKAEGREAMARSKAAQEQRAALVAATPPPALARYERIRATTQPAVVALNHGSCGGCGVTVSTALQQKVAADDLAQCINCGRLLTQ